MKIQHWAIICIIIVLPISIICRNVISKKNLLLRDETRYNNIVDNATYDAISQIVEVSEELGYGKNIPITHAVADAAVDRFFNTLCVNFNMPIGRELAESYFCQYIPAIIIVGYDGLYVYSYEPNSEGYEYVLKPKIPYAYTYEKNGKKVVINFTLDNYVTLYFKDMSFLVGMPDETGNMDGTHVISGYVGEFLDIDQNGVDDLNDMVSEKGVLVEWDGKNVESKYTENDDPFGIEYIEAGINGTDKIEYLMNQVPSFTDNLSYILKQLDEASYDIAGEFNFLCSDDTNQDYEYDINREVTNEASEFHALRRETIINLIRAVMKEEFNEHNVYADIIGLTYDFNIPDIAREQWNNTIDDISVLAFMQGMPMGGDTYYNNYSLGGSRIVQANYLYAETVNGHRVYHKHYCPLIPKNKDGSIRYSDGTDFPNEDFPDRMTSGIQEIFINADHAREANYYVCSECM